MSHAEDILNGDSCDMINIKLDMFLACDEGERGHPQRVMKKLGIKYHSSTPQSMYDCWFFWNCEGYPDTLPKYLTKITIDPKEYIGHGLTREDVEAIKQRELDND